MCISNVASLPSFPWVAVWDVCRMLCLTVSALVNYPRSEHSCSSTVYVPISESSKLFEAITSSGGCQLLVCVSARKRRLTKVMYNL